MIERIIKSVKVNNINLYDVTKTITDNNDILLLSILVMKGAELLTYIVLKDDDDIIGNV